MALKERRNKTENTPPLQPGSPRCHRASHSGITTHNEAPRCWKRQCRVATEVVRQMWNGWKGSGVRSDAHIMAFRALLEPTFWRRYTEEARTCEAWFQLTFLPQKWNLKAHMWYQLSPFPSSNVAICDAAPPRQQSPILRYSATPLLRAMF